MGARPGTCKVHGNGLGKWLAMEVMCSKPLQSSKRHCNQGSDTDSTVGLQGGSDSDVTEGIWEQLGLQHMDRLQVTTEASRATSTNDTQTANNNDSQEDLNEKLITWLDMNSSSNDD